ENNSDMHLLENRLLNRDYLVLDAGRADLAIDKQGDELIFMHKGREVLRTAQKLFLSDPGKYLKSFSDRTDRYNFFRGFTYPSILIGFPVLLYLLVQIVLQFVLYPFRNTTTRLTASSIICLLIGIVLFVPVHKGASVNLEKQDIDILMKSARWQDQSAALRMICREKLDIADYPAYLKMKESPYISVRYWLARAAGIGKKSETYSDLIALLNDSHPNVVCQALEALGQRRDKKAVEAIKQKIKESDHWHVQAYAYYAMRDLGWKQKKSTSNN
ncbi:MAG: HEAT repeat domain-containing protein, partial [Deltaproteobacteria bacterium]|nr:HEAT repeat domain-containing protein [Deltaproteobacteria bacterium]